MTEHRDIPGHEGFMIGDDGVVWTCWGNRKRCQSRKNWTRLDHWEEVVPWDHQGYSAVYLKGMRLVHHLVLEAFIGQCPPGLECRHLNDVRSDNRLENLVWGTKQENALDRSLNDRQYRPTNVGRVYARGYDHPRSLLSELESQELIALRTAGVTLTDIAKHMNVSLSTVKRTVFRMSQ